MFLGPITVVPADQDVSDLRSRIDRLDSSCSFLIVEGSGVLINDKMTAAESAVLNGFVEVIQRIEASAPIRYLTEYEVRRIMSADGHRYRISAENSGPS
jgi:hypothetical protein